MAQVIDFCGSHKQRWKISHNSSNKYCPH